MAKLSKTEVLHVAELAKLKLTSNELDKYATQLSKAVELVGELSEVNTEGVEPVSQTTGLENIQRPDDIKTESILSSDAALSGTDETFNGYFKVEAILTERSDK